MPAESSAVDGANALLAHLVAASEAGRFTGFMNRVATDLGFSATRVSRALQLLCDARSVEVLQRGHGRSPTRLRILDPTPIEDRDRSARRSLADRLLLHLRDLSDGGVVEYPLVDVARELDVGPPSVSRALGQLVDAGLARVDRGTRSRPTRIELVAAREDDSDEATRLRREIAEHRAALQAARERLAALGERPRPD